MPELLFEILSEEIPARMQKAAQRQLVECVDKILRGEGLEGFSLQGFVTPRRLGLMGKDLPSESPTIAENRKGPRLNAPEKAIAGFLKSCGLTHLDQCEIEEDGKGEYYVAKFDRPGRATSQILAQSLPTLLSKFSWPKSMRLAGDSSVSWIRPIHRILCVFEGKIVPFSFAGIDSSNMTEGHRLMGRGPFQIDENDVFEDTLEKNFVHKSHRERHELISIQAHQLCKKQQIELIEDDNLVEEIAGLTEYPHLILGRFSAEFLALPDEVIRLTMRHHQKFLSTRVPESKKIAPFFITAANIRPSDDGTAIAKGNERVLAARLQDARHFILMDLKRDLSDYVEQLKGKIYHEKLGSLYEKAQRIEELSGRIAEKLGYPRNKARQAGRLAKADLVTQMVGEFAQLQGQMGGFYYRQEEGSDPEIAQAIEQHYRPQGPSDPLPEGDIAICVALADKLDSLVCFFSVDEKPTGSKDPYALRRAALGMIRILQERGLELDLSDFITPEQKELRQFLSERLKVALRDQNIPHDIVEAGLSDPSRANQLNMLQFTRHIQALHGYLQTESGLQLRAAAKRCDNLLNSKAAAAAKEPKPAIFEHFLSQPENDAEKALINIFSKLEQQIHLQLDWREKAAKLDQICEPLNRYFDQVMILAPDPDLRDCRVKLLKEIQKMLAQLAEFSKLEG